MTQTLLALVLWLLLMGVASGAGLALVGAWPWAPAARAAGVALAVGLASAPLLAGLAAVGSFWALPGAGTAVQLAAAFALLGGVALAGWFSGSIQRTAVSRGELVPRGPAAVLCWGFFAAIAIDIAVLPLIQNDALEYATAARILFDARDLASYPALQPTQHASGFYGPWTHPPLFVALLAAGYGLQGSAESTLLLRWVAPWCLAGAAACVAALGRWAHPERPSAGPLAALLLVSTPLLFLGAASALIDALPVLGITLALTAVLALGGAWWRRALGIGAMLGLALWTHSQAVLVPLLTLPLLGLQGPGRWPQRLLEAVKVAVPALAVAVLVGGAPYARNVALFGAPISDNPVVFALPSLDWPGYFKEQRGLASAAELIQYGLLKPWFALEAYGLVFWLALLAPLHRRQPLARVQDHAQWLQPMCLALIGLYLVGAVLSVALGIDLMVRNERYMLILLPAAALLAGGALSWPFWRRTVLALVGVQLAVLLLYRLGQLRPERGPVGPPSALASVGREEQQLRRWGPYGAVRFLREQAPAASRVLSLKPADMFYAGRTMLSYLDPRLVPFYAERDAAAAAAQLRAMGVSHVHLPDYWLPPVYNSAVMAIVADPGLAALRFDAAGYQVYELQAPARGAGGDALCGQPLNFGEWFRAREFVLGGRKNLWRVGLGAAPHAEAAVSLSWNPTSLFRRETKTSVRGEVSLPPPLAAAAAPAAVGAAAQRTEWLLHLELAGEGYVQAQVRARGAGGALQLVGDRPLTEGATVVMQRRLTLDAATQRLELRLDHRADSRLQVQRATLTAVCVVSAR